MLLTAQSCRHSIARTSGEIVIYKIEYFYLLRSGIYVLVDNKLSVEASYSHSK